jgi:MGT family glycosyltransferase
VADLLMATWDGAGTTPPLMSVAGALVERGHRLRVLADPILRPDVEAAGAEHVSWSTAPHRIRPGRDGDFVRDWEAADPATNFGFMRDRLAVGPAESFARDVRAEIDRRRPAIVLSELLIFGPLVAAEAAGVPAVVLNPTINVIPAPGVPPFGAGLMPARDDAERAQHAEAAEGVLAAWNVALPALNRARASQGLPPVAHVLDQGRSAARVLILTSRAFDLPAELPPVVKYVGPRLDDPGWVGSWSPPPGDGPLVLVALSCDYQAQEDLLGRIIAALGQEPVRGVVTTGRGIEPSAYLAPPNVQVLRAAPHREVLQEASLVVTHAGHGSTIKALAAGVPLVCLPMGRDQLDVAARVVHAGAGLRLDAESPPQEIAAAVRKVLRNGEYRQAAQRVAAVIAEETATDLAVAEIESLL